jgi:hypothetical protein
MTLSPSNGRNKPAPAPGSRLPLWPPARPIRRVLAAARKRYLRERPEGRPALADTGDCCGLFTRSDLLTLARFGYWPLPPQALAWLAESPWARACRRRRWADRIAAVVREVLAAELPAAVAYLARQNGRA